MKKTRPAPPPDQPTPAQPRSADTPDATNLTPPKTSGTEPRSRSEPPSPNRQAHIAESPASSSARPESRGQHETAEDGDLAWVSPPLGDDVVEAILQLPDGKGQLEKKTEGLNKDDLQSYWRDLKKGMTVLLQLMKTGVSGSSVPEGWRPYRPAPHPLSLKEELEDPLERLEVGSIINIPLHTSTRNWTTSLFDVHETPTICGGAYTKARPVVVVGLYSDHADCVPMYSHNNKGIDNKRDEQKAEYIAVQNKGGKRWVEKGCNVLKATSNPLIPGWFPKENSYFKFTERVTHHYGRMCGIMGKLDGASQADLQRLIK